MFRLLAAIITFVVAIIAIIFLGVIVFVIQELDLLKPFMIAAVIVLILVIAVLKS